MVSNINNDVKLQNIRCTQTGVTPVNFRANSTNTLERTPEKDSVETKKEEKKKKLPLAAKIGIGVVGGFAALVATLTLISKHQTKALTKLYKEKMVFKELPEKLEFKEAKTLDEAIKFAKETLGIEKIDKNITLDAMNFANRGIVDVSNANKGHLFVPKTLKFADKGEKFIAAVEQDIKSNDFGSLIINKDFFSHEALNNKINKTFLLKDGNKVFSGTNPNIYWNDIKACYVPTHGYIKDLQKFYKSPDSLTINQKRNLYWGYQNALNHSKINCNYTPEKFYKLAIEQNGKQKYTLQEFKAFSLEKQKEILKQTLDKQPIIINLEQNSGIKTIYHEMGHLQDFAKNLKELDVKFWDFDFIKTWKKAWQEAKNKVEKGIKPEKKDYKIDFVENRWGGSTYDGYKELLKNNPKKFQEKYPDLYKHLTDKEIQNITGQVSWYSQTSIGEFVAEVYAGLIEGRKFTDDVINLYKKYNGPLLPGI